VTDVIAEVLDVNMKMRLLIFVRLHVPEFVEPENWLPNNPVDYSIWGALQQLVYRRRRIRDVEHLKELCKLTGSRLVKMLSIAL